MSCVELRTSSEALTDSTTGTIAASRPVRNRSGHRGRLSWRQFLHLGISDNALMNRVNELKPRLPLEVGGKTAAVVGNGSRWKTDPMTLGKIVSPDAGPFSNQ
jgi:hypothetical protein